MIRSCESMTVQVAVGWSGGGECALKSLSVHSKSISLDGKTRWPFARRRRNLMKGYTSRKCSKLSPITFSTWSTWLALWIENVRARIASCCFMKFLGSSTLLRSPMWSGISGLLDLHVEASWSVSKAGFGNMISLQNAHQMRNKSSCRL